MDREVVSIPVDQLAAFLDVAKQIRMGFLICAPRFSAGSQGERMVELASEFGKSIEDMAAKLRESCTPK